MVRISVVVNTHNEEVNLARCLNGVYGVVSEIIVVDMESTDKTRTIAKQFNAKVYNFPYKAYVEPARNFALNKAKGDWILILDADELISDQLLKKLTSLAASNTYDFIRIPRKNIIFNRWIEHSGWWPDYQIRFFKKGSVTWGEEIHSIPITTGAGFDLPGEEKNALIHYNYQTITQFLDRLNRYTTIEVQQLVEDGQQFVWQDLIRKPSQEFLSRFFQAEGYKDGLHGFVLATLQSISQFVLYLKVWEGSKFNSIASREFLDEITREKKQAMSDYMYWFFQKKALTSKGVSTNILKLRSRLRL